MAPNEPHLMRIFSTDHKVIGLQYAFTSLAFLLVGFLLITLVRWRSARCICRSTALW